MVQIKWSKLALADLKLIKAYIAQDSEKYAQLTTDKIISKIDVLITYPEIGKIWKEQNEKIYRELLEGNYRIFYSFNPNTNEIRILSIFHSSRDIDNLVLE